MDIFAQLIRDEGLRLKPYKDSVGKLTIGVGRNLDDVGISQSEALSMLANDIALNRAAVLNALPWAGALSEPRLSVFVEMCFNLGIDGLLGFRNFLAAAQSGDYETAAKEGLNSLWAKQVGQRAIRLMQQLRTGEWV